MGFIGHVLPDERHCVYCIDVHPESYQVKSKSNKISLIQTTKPIA